MKIIECSNIEENYIRMMEEDAREAWAKELVAELRAQDELDG
jgi:hypothetical protein